jgi:hypothetical protein
MRGANNARSHVDLCPAIQGEATPQPCGILTSVSTPTRTAITAGKSLKELQMYKNESVIAFQIIDRSFMQLPEEYIDNCSMNRE